MCGICVVMCRSKTFNGGKEVYGRYPNLIRRGPDHHGNTSVTVDDSVGIYFHGYVLHHRGQLTPQPCQDSMGNILLWNGEIFAGYEVTEVENDTKILLHKLSQGSVLSIMSAIQGPWAFVYWEANEKKLWFGRDCFGRRSLVWNLEDKDFLTLSSVSLPELSCTEVPAVGVYCISFDSQVGARYTESEMHTNLAIDLYPWSYLCDDDDMAYIKSCSQSLPSDRYLLKVQKPIIDPISNSSLIKSVSSRLTLTSPTSKQLEQDSEETEIHDTSGSDPVCASPLEAGATSSGSIPRELITPTLQKAALQLIDVLQEAVRKRVDNQATLCQQCMKSSLPEVTAGVSSKLSCSHSRLAILFSGGIDSTVIAALAHRCYRPGEPIDLLNVAFEHPRKPATSKKSRQRDDSHAEDLYSVPDRLTGLEAVEELREACPGRRWNWVEIDVPLEELQRCRQERISEVLHPLITVLDDSIGCAVWFAARGQGTLLVPGAKPRPYTSPARVVLCGMGADEQLCGYTRHRNVYRDGGLKGLEQEVDMELKRISSRNLGRDDRMISDHSRESRYPFLDEEVVVFLKSLPLSLRANLELPRGIGEKIVLRVAAEILGLPYTAVRQKRAIQFGSRIAKAEGGSKEKANQTCTRLVT